MNNFIRVVFIVTLLSCHTVVMSQNTFSPYSILGIGDIYNRSMSHAAGMGEVGIGTPSVWNINNQNPALLTTNTLTVFEFSVQGETRDIQNKISSEKAGTAGYKNLSFAFPVIPGKWTANVGMTPYSSVNYNFNSLMPIINSTDSVLVERTGNGGISEVNFSNGIRLYKGLSIGVRASFLFGFTEHQTKSTLQNNLQQFPTGVREKTNYTGFTYGFGVSYIKKLGESGNSLGMGLIYDLNKDLEGSRLLQLEANTLAGSVIVGDTLTQQSYDDAFHLPSKLGFGVSWIKDNFMTIGLDVTYQDWRSDAGYGNDNETYRSAYTAAIGLEITPDYDDVDNYFARVRYRFGFRYEKLPYDIGGTDIDDLGFSFGWSLPVRTVSSVNMAFKLGQRGTTDNNLVKENYFKFIIGATINDRWFVRRKYN